MVEDLHQQSWRIEKDEIMSSFAIMRSAKYYYFRLIYNFSQNQNNDATTSILLLGTILFNSFCTMKIAVV